MVVEENLSKSLYKIELYLIKVIPFLMALCCFLNTVLSYFCIDVPLFSYLSSVSLFTLIFLYLSSYVFKFCLFHRLPLHYVTINWILNIIDYYVEISLNNRDLLSLYLIITFVFIVISLYGHNQEKLRKITQRNSR